LSSTKCFTSSQLAGVTPYLTSFFKTPETLNILRLAFSLGTATERDTLNFPPKSPQNRLKPFRGILHHPNPRNAPRSALKRKSKIQRILSQNLIVSAALRFLL
jgi:hypothetical protein